MKYSSKFCSCETGDTLSFIELDRTNFSVIDNKKNAPGIILLLSMGMHRGLPVC